MVITTTFVRGDFLIMGQVGGYVKSSLSFYYLSNWELLKDVSQYDIPPTIISNFNFSKKCSDAQFLAIKDDIYYIPWILSIVNDKKYGLYLPDVGYYQLLMIRNMVYIYQMLDIHI